VIRVAVLWALALVLVAVPTASQAAGHTDPQPAGIPAPPAVDSFRSVRTFADVAPPVRLRVPAARVDTALQLLHRRPDATVAVPDSPAVAGWYADGPRPGQPGPAVILGHVDSTAGPGVFYRLFELDAGAEVLVDRADGSTVGFRVVAVTRVPKTSFPTDLVYAPTLQPSLELVTCGGTFDHRRRSYRDNVIVTAVPA
jgi:hypothetical protein